MWFSTFVHLHFGLCLLEIRIKLKRYVRFTCTSNFDATTTVVEHTEDFTWVSRTCLPVVPCLSLKIPWCPVVWGDIFGFHCWLLPSVGTHLPSGPVQSINGMGYSVEFF